ncbi:MAG: YIP1 family protein [Candidatus Marinimicrobia bacterium]|nr:YIP1 family protein [Candidatus Neomarinimicrobiota bacterium]
MGNTSRLQRFIDLFFVPSRAFDDFVNGVSFKDWLIPLLIVTAAIVILPFFFRDVSFYEAEQRLIKTEQSIANNPDIPDDTKEMISERMHDAREKINDSRENPLALRNLWGYPLIPIMLFIMAAFFSAILLLVGNFGLGGQVKFFQIFSMVMMTYLISGNGFFMNMIPGVGTLELLVKTPLIMIKESTDMIFSPGLIFDDIDSFFKQFLNQLDIFRIWGMVVMGFGFAKLYNKPTATGMIAVGIPWLILVSLGAALLQANSVGMG